MSDLLDGFLDDASALDAPGGPSPDSPLVGLRLVHDTALPLLRGHTGPIGVVVTGGAGQVAGPAALCGRLGLRLARLELTARDPSDPVGAVRRLVAGVDAAALPDEVEVRVALPGSPADPSWLAAADEVSMAGHALTLADGPEARAGIDAALDRELVFGFRECAAARALELLATTQELFDGESGSLERGRRWFRSYWSTDPVAHAAELAA